MDIRTRSPRKMKSVSPKRTASASPKRKTARKTVRKSTRKTVRKVGGRRIASRRMSRKSGARKMSGYNKFVKAKRAAIRTEAKTRGVSFLKVAAEMYKASSPKASPKKRTTRRRAPARVGMMSAPAEARLVSLFSRKPLGLRMRKMRVSRSRRSASPRMASSPRKAGGVALYLKTHKAEVRDYAQSHGMMGKRGYAVKAAAALYKMQK